jgi:DNA-binding NarL/FixJ family response regulator
MPHSASSIVLVDDHIVVRNGLKELIELLGNLKVVQQFDNGQQLLDALPFKNKVDLIIMDINMPVLNGHETMKKLKELEVNTPVLILTLNTNEDVIINMYKLGVRGYLEKDCTAPGLKQAIDDVLKTGYHHNDLIFKALASDQLPKGRDARQHILNQLSDKEIKFLDLVCNDAEYTYEQMAQIMKVSVRTIDGYRQGLFERFNIKSKTGLVLFAIKNKLYDGV